MADKIDVPNVMTPKFRVSFPNVFRPGKPVDPTKPESTASRCCFDKDANLEPLKKAMVDFMTKKFGATKPRGRNSPPIRFGIKGKNLRGYVAGAKFINATSNTKPGLVDAQNNDIINEADFYPGCYARATVRPFWYDTAGTKASRLDYKISKARGWGTVKADASRPRKSLSLWRLLAAVDLIRRRRPRIFWITNT